MSAREESGSSVACACYRRIWTSQPGGLPDRLLQQAGWCPVGIRINGGARWISSPFCPLLVPRRTTRESTNFFNAIAPPGPWPGRWMLRPNRIASQGDAGSHLKAHKTDSLHQTQGGHGETTSGHGLGEGGAKTPRACAGTLIGRTRQDRSAVAGGVHRRFIHRARRPTHLLAGSRARDKARRSGCRDEWREAAQALCECYAREAPFRPARPWHCLSSRTRRASGAGYRAFPDGADDVRSEPCTTRAR